MRNKVVVTWDPGSNWIKQDHIPADNTAIVAVRQALRGESFDPPPGLSPSFSRDGSKYHEIDSRNSGDDGGLVNRLEHWLATPTNEGSPTFANYCIELLKSGCSLTLAY